MDQYIGKMLDNRYELLEVIGSGGMSVVYKAKCHRLNRMVAIKVLRSELVEDADFRRRFRDESQAVAMLSHPNIVSVYDVSRGGDMEYIVMELIDGITLKQYIEKRGQLNWREALHFITQIMRGLSHAHSRGIVHRDIKPQNVMVLRDGSVKIADFGIACLSNSANTLTQEALGSVHYISPEQARGERVTARSDIYSSGVVLYEMLTSHLPFEGDNAVAVALQHISSIPLSPRELNSNIPPALELICMKAMTADADKRYQSADEMINALEEFRKNPDIDLDFSLKDLQPKESNEPTAQLPVADVKNLSHQVKHKAAELDADDDDDGFFRPAAGEKKKKTLMIVGIVLLAAVLLFGIAKLIVTSMNSEKDVYPVPPLIGMTEEEAAELEGVKDIFTISVIGARNSTEYEAGQIIEQDPKPDEKLKIGSAIEVYVSIGDGSQEMPKVVGMDFQEARVVLSNMNIDLHVADPDEVYSDSVPAGKVISSVPAEGESLSKGNTVYMVVSKGPEPVPVTVISFIGKTESEAKNSAEKLGLVVKDITSREDSAPEGQVIEQSIQPGSTVEAGEEISFVISEGPPAGSITRVYNLPWAFFTEESVHAVIEVDDETVYDEVVSTTMGSIQYTFTGKGTIHVKVYFNDVLTEEEDIRLN